LPTSSALPTGSAIAWTYVRRIEAHCHRLSDFPRRGRPRDEFAPGVRSIAFERRATILYRIEGDEVIILSVVYAGREAKLES
jgi:toxin ParE1/3/4